LDALAADPVARAPSLGQAGGKSEEGEMTAATRGRVRVEPSQKRVRGWLGGRWAFDTLRPLLVWEIPYYPAYYIHHEDVDCELVDTGERRHSPSRGDATVYDVTSGATTVKAGAYGYTDSEISELNGYLRFEWDAVEQWFEEDEQIYVHPRNPYARVDVLPSSRHVQVEIDGVLVADSHQPRILFETGLPPRYYLPKTDVRMELLRDSATHTECPYKGEAHYYDVAVNGTRHPDLVWWYPTPLPESQRVIGLVCFYNEKVDLIIDGERVARPHTHFS
jgi:uncharacterized protein (DUF427 family)